MSACPFSSYLRIGLMRGAARWNCRNSIWAASTNIALRLSAAGQHSDSTAERKCHAVIAVLNCGRGCSKASLAGKRGPPEAHGSFLRPSDSRINFGDVLLVALVWRRGYVTAHRPYTPGWKVTLVPVTGPPRAS